MRPDMRHPRPAFFAGIAGVLLIVAACSSATGGSTAPSAAASSAPSAAASAATSAAAAGETYEVKVATGTVGMYLTGEDGKTLYTFSVDKPNSSNCADTCATNWPPFTVSGADTLKAGDGVTGKLTTFARPDGSMQVAYNGAPLYYFAKDTKAGDTNGQGVSGKWYVASPTGASASPAASPAQTKSGY
jgi:predicted lipoprotein with Yx(FWY)xxD motif